MEIKQYDWQRASRVTPTRSSKRNPNKRKKNLESNATLNDLGSDELKSGRNAQTKGAAAIDAYKTVGTWELSRVIIQFRYKCVRCANSHRFWVYRGADKGCSVLKWKKNIKRRVLKKAASISHETHWASRTSFDYPIHGMVKTCKL